MDTKEYTVTAQAGPKVAGRRVEPGDTLTLTAAEALAEELAGAILEKGKEPKGGEPSPAAAKRRADTQARARGAESARAEQAAVAVPAAAEPAAQA